MIEYKPESLLLMIYEWKFLIQAFFTLIWFESDTDMSIFFIRISDFEKVSWIH